MDAKRMMMRSKVILYVKKRVKGIENGREGYKCEKKKQSSKKNNDESIPISTVASYGLS